MRGSMRRRAELARLAAALVATAALLAAAALAGCGLAVQSPDLFALTRTGVGKTLTMLVNYGGTVSCDGGPAKTLSDHLLLVARDLPVQLQTDAQRKLDLPSSPGSVYRFKVRLQYGTIAFPDTAAAKYPALAQLEQFVLQAQPACGARGRGGSKAG
jgi:hypothetical protein